MGIFASRKVADPDSSRNLLIKDVLGNKEDAAARTADVISLVAIARKVLEEATEIEEHIHSGERWLGVAAAPAGETHIADRIGAGAATAEAGPLVVDAGNDDWGTWTQILGSSDTPTDSGSKVAFDLHRMRISGSEDTAQRYMIQIALQEDAPADDPGSSDVYTETDLISQGVGALGFIEPILLQGCRVAATTKVWMRTRAPGLNTSTLSFYIGLHEYTY